MWLVHQSGGVRLGIGTFSEPELVDLSAHSAIVSPRHWVDKLPLESIQVHLLESRVSLTVQIGSVRMLGRRSRNQDC